MFQAIVPQKQAAGQDHVAVDPFARQSTVMPSDPLLPSQWHNVGNANVDINITEAWTYFSGLGVKFGVYDDGINATHVDLEANYNASLHVTINGVFDNPTIFNTGDAHGTAVAGLIASIGGNGQGGVGGSFNATLTGVDIFGTGGNAYLFGAMNEQDRFDVTNHSWGWVNPFTDNRLNTSWTNFFSGLQDAAANGRLGLGTIQMVAAGNDRTGFDNANTSNFTSSRFVNAIAAIADSGQLSYYSNPGASLLVSSPSNGGSLGITTTDYTGTAGYGAGDYTSTFGGTSAATPIASGVVGLMLEANPGLGYRDVMEILAITARQIGNPTAAGEAASLRPWQVNGATNWNNGGLHFSHDYGFGLIDAFAAVKLADSWNLLQTYANELEVSASNTAAGAVPDNNVTGISRSITLTPASATAVTIEAIEVQINWSVAHSYSGDLVIELISPSGMISYLHDRAGGAADLTNWVFTTRAHLGELAAGTWTVRISDRAAVDVGTVSSITVRAFGSSDLNDNYYYTDEFGTATTALPARQTLADTDSGSDTINLAALSTGASINLNAGQTNNVAGSSFVIASGTVIENVIGSWSNDRIEGNAADNTLRGNAGNDTLLGNDGSDSIYGGAGSDTVDGGNGTDFYIIEAAWDAVQWVVTDLTVTFNFIDQVLGTDVVTNIEAFLDSFGVKRLLAELAGQPPVVLPTAPVITGFGDNSGVANDARTNDTTPTLTITTEPDVESVGVFLNGLSQGDATRTNGAFTFTPTNLADGAYTFTAIATKAGLQSSASTALRLTIDTAAPILASLTPVDNAAAVSPTSNILLTFSEAVLAGAGTISIWLASTATLWRSMDIGSPEVSIVGSTVTINPSVDLPTLTSFYVTIDAGALTDLAGNSFAGLIDSTTFNFNTAAGEMIFGTAGADILAGAAGNDTINGLAGADNITGDAGDDVIDGGAADDILNGGSNTAVGDTVSYASTTGGVTVSLASAASQNTVGAGRDTLLNFENLFGSAFNDRLTGSAAANRIDGGTGNDTITGGGGTDTVNGGAGSDVYLVTALGDKTAAEISDTGTSGVDELRFAGAANSTLTLFAGDTGLERVAIGTGTGATAVTTATTALNVDATAGANGLTIIGNAGANRLAGTAFADRIEGGAGNDTIIGGAGADAVYGGAGDDLFVVSLAADLATGEVIYGEAGTDELRFAATAASTLALTAGTSVERVVIGTGTAAAAVVTATTALNVDATVAANALSITGNAGINTLTGSAFADTLDGGAGNDVLIGGLGNDSLIGGAGNDVLTGSAGTDTFVFNFAPNATTNRDTITDFNVIDDTIALENAVFTALGLATGPLSAADFVIGTGAADATDRIIYNNTTGALLYDADGSGAGAAVQFAQLTGTPILTVNDFLII